MPQSGEESVRGLAEWLKQQGVRWYRDALQVGRELGSRRSTRRARRAEQLVARLSRLIARQIARVGREQPVPLRLVLTLALPVVSTLVLLNLIAGAQVAKADGCTWYNVRPGDTLGAIGATYGVSVQTLAATNHISNPDLILVGQRLCIPSTSSAGGGTNGEDTGTAPGPVSGSSAFIALALPYAQRAHQQTQWPMSVILAQWGLEQGWKAPGYTGYNWGNVAALPGEPTVGGTHVWGSPGAFAYAKTPEDGLRYYLHVAGLGYYSAVAPAAQSGGADAAARALGRSPWDAAHYTSRGDPGSSLIALMQRYNLYQYDG